MTLLELLGLVLVAIGIALVSIEAGVIAAGIVVALFGHFGPDA